MGQVKFKEFLECCSKMCSFLKGDSGIVLNVEERTISDDYLNLHKDVLSIFDEGKLLEDFQNSCGNFAAAMLYLSSKINSVEKLFFEDKQIAYDEFYNTACFFYIMQMSASTSHRMFLNLYIQEINDLTLAGIISILGNEPCPEKYRISESEFYNSLQELSLSDVSLIFSIIDGDSETLSVLKKSIVDKDEDRFLNTLMTHEIDYKTPAFILAIWLIMLKQKTIYGIQIQQRWSEESANKIIESLNCMSTLNRMNFNLLKLNHDLVSLLTSFKEDIFKNTIADWEAIMQILQSNKLDLALNHRWLRLISPSKEATSQLDTILMEDEELAELYEDYLSQNEPSLSEFKPKLIPEFALFKEKFLERLILSPSIGKKTRSDYIQSSKCYNKDFCSKLYYALAKEGYLAYSEDAFYSFVCRMSCDYWGENEPCVIVWNGPLRDLFHLTFWFTDEGDSKIWKKTAQFFALANGGEIKTNGAKNQAEGPSERMKVFMKKLNSELH